LPQPDGPSRTVKVPGATSIEIRSSALVEPQRRLTPMSRTDAPVEVGRDIG
jgi:hypothetical protein